MVCRWVSFNDITDTTAMDRSRPPNPSGRPLVLIVEAHEDTRALYALALSMMGFDVIAAEDGTDGVRRAQEIHPDIIVTDLSMPNCDGWKFLQDLKASSQTRDIPVVAVSEHVQRLVCKRGERNGFAALLPKPCLPDELALRLRRVLDGHRDTSATSCSEV